MKKKQTKKDSRFDQLKRVEKRGNKILQLDSKSKLSPNQIDALFAFANHVNDEVTRKWLKVGEVVSRIVKATPKWSLEKRKKEFDTRLKMGYQRAMAAKRLSEFYADTPKEVDERGTTASDLLTRFKTPKERTKEWKRTGSVDKLRKRLRPSQPSPKRKKKIKDIKDSNTETLADGFEKWQKGRHVTIRIDTRKFPKAAQLLEQLCKQLLRKPVKIAA